MIKGSRLKAAREKCNLTAEELGSLVGVSKTAISLYEAEKRNPKIDTLLEIMYTLGVSCDYLLGADFFVKYIATMEQKQKITSIQHKRLEEKLVANNTPRIETEETETTIPKVQIKDLVDVKDIKWYEKVYLFLKRIFGKKNK